MKMTEIDGVGRLVQSGDPTFDPMAIAGRTLLLVFSRPEVQKGAVGGAVDTLYRLNDDKKPFEKWGGKLKLGFAGFEEESKPWEIAEVRGYFRAITAQWPFWMHFCSKDDQGLGVAGRLLCTEEVRVSGRLAVDPIKFPHVYAKLTAANRQLYASMGMRASDSAKVEELARPVMDRLVAG